MNVTERFEKTRELRMHQYWLEKHARKRIEAAIQALNAGQTYSKVAEIMGLNEDTLRRNGIVRGGDPDKVTFTGLIGDTNGGHEATWK